MLLDLIVDNARIHTMDAARPQASRLGVLAGRVVGLDDELTGLSARQRFDAAGAAVVPGFNDVHCHTTWYGLTLAEIDLGGLRTIPEVYQRLRTGAENLGSGDWIFATGFNHHEFGGNYPDIAVLDQIAGGRPLYIRQTSGHSAIANTESLRRAGVFAPGFTDPEGGLVRRDEQGNPTGLLEETAQALIQDLVRPYSQADIRAALDRATRHYAAEGITSFSEAGIAGGWIGHSPAEVAAYQAARESGQLHARAQLMPAMDVLHPVAANADDGFGIGLDLGMRSGFGDDYLSIGPVKIFLDGALSGETAALTECYCSNPDKRGYLQGDADELKGRIIDAYRSGWALAVHAIGDAAIDLAIDAIGTARKRFGPPAVPSRIEHAAVVRPDQLPKLRDAEIAVTPQAAFFDAIGDGMMASLGEERSGWTYRAKSFIDGGVLMPGSSDRPCADGNALRGIQAFVDRKTRSGATFGAGSEKLSAYEALRAYTAVSGQATGFGDRKGTLVPGMLADFTVLENAPMDVATEDIAGIEVLGTAVGGEFTHGG
ncbi:amidohydrolase [Saxibacter everestensis]|uniref:Amidohydrolase n=1 Tax=Saxibacter everestensis TaxID=2909229 RepID=A0ABY8QQ48_9MICO|nr:amidohydrolase [Brevibacteriaceae bacterium ZFBP1038]